MPSHILALLMKTSHRTSYLIQIIGFDPLLISNLGSSYAPDFGVMMLAIVIATVPTALIFFLMQRHFVAGMMGSIK